MSYEEFFHLKDAPFRLTPDPDYFFPSAVHKEALDTMVFSINAGEGFVLITGNPGSGKTLLVRTLLRQLGDKINLALVLNPTLTPRELLRVILDDLHVFDMDEIEKMSKEKLLRLFRDNLLENAARGIKTIIIIDEAQNLPRETLEELRMLSNLESDKEKLLQIILVGQLELEETLKKDDMKQLAQRISIRYRLHPLSSDETGGYVRHRLEVAGGNMNVSFMPRVMNRIHSLSKGIPRRINIICERALMAAYVDGEKNVSRKHLVRAIKSIEGHEDRIRTVPQWIYPALGGAALVLAIFLVVFRGTPDVPAPPAPAVQEQALNIQYPDEHKQPESQGTDLKSVPPVGSEQQASSNSDLKSAPPVGSEQQASSNSGAVEPEPVSKTAIQANARVLPETPPAPAAEPEQVASTSEPGPQFQSQGTDLKSVPQSEASAQPPAPHASLLTPHKTGPSPLPAGFLPANEFLLAVDRDNNTARLLQGTAADSVVKHEFQLDWRIMEGLYVLGNDAATGAFIFNPVLFEWGGYNLLNAAALWRQVGQHVADSLVPVIVYSGGKLDKELLSADIPAIRESIGSWSQSWQERNIAKLMSFYGNSFTSYTIDDNQPQAYSRSQLADIRGRILGTSSYISLKISTPVCLIDPLNPDLAIVVFRQEYISNIYQDMGTKVLYLRREGNYPERPWKIVAKFFLPKEEL